MLEIIIYYLQFQDIICFGVESGIRQQFFSLFYQFHSTFPNAIPFTPYVSTVTGYQIPIK
jgi:hypothetical protein